MEFDEEEVRKLTENEGDELLNIRTKGNQQGFHESLHHNRYEPTPYKILKVLFSRYHLASEDRLVDFGCGKGRMNFYIHHLAGSSSAGVEMNTDFYEDALKNLEIYARHNKNILEKIDFYNCLAQDYPIDPRDNRFYFFNPFSVQIFMKVINNILRSTEQHERSVELILFYASEDYIDFLEHQTVFEMTEEIALPGMQKDLRERFLVYRLS